MGGISIAAPCALIDLARYLACFAVLLAGIEGLLTRRRIVGAATGPSRLSLPPSVSASSNLAACALSVTVVGVSGLGLDVLEAPAGAALTVVVWRGLITSALGYDTSDFMVGALLANVTVASLSTDPTHCSRIVWLSALLWMAMYVISGIAKLSKPWVTGTALTTILTATSFGSARVGAMLQRHAAVTRAAQSSVVAFEIAAPVLFLVTPLPIPYIALAFALLLHLGTLLMGLTGFAAAFVAYGPLLVYTIEETH